MDAVKNLPEIMSRAREDLLGNVRGRFSPDDWQRILGRARERYDSLRLGLPAPEAWAETVREFHRERYWGFVPDYQPPRPPLPGVPLGVHLILMTFLTFTVGLMAVVWLGQNYAASGSGRDGLLLAGAIFLVVANIGYFLWRSRGHPEN